MSLIEGEGGGQKVCFDNNSVFPGYLSIFGVVLSSHPLTGTFCCCRCTLHLRSWEFFIVLRVYVASLFCEFLIIRVLFSL